MKLCSIPTLVDRVPSSVVSLDVRMKWVSYKEDYVRFNDWEFLHLFDISIVVAGVPHLLEDKSRHLRQLTLVHPGVPEVRPGVKAVFDHTLCEFEAEAFRMGLEKFQTIERTNWKECSNVNTRRYRYSSKHKEVRWVFSGPLGVDVTRLEWEQLLEEMHKKNATFSLVIYRASRLTPIMERGVRLL